MKKILTVALVLIVTLAGCKNTITITKAIYHAHKSIKQKMDSTYQAKQLQAVPDTIQAQQQPDALQ